MTRPFLPPDLSRCFAEEIQNKVKAKFFKITENSAMFWKSDYQAHHGEIIYCSFYDGLAVVQWTKKDRFRKNYVWQKSEYVDFNDPDAIDKIANIVDGELSNLDWEYKGMGI